jgi:Polyketide cyclase / dehydrase and lipid transport
MSNLRYAESIFVARSPETLYDMVSDVSRMGDWSPVCTACWWDDGDGPRPGAWFTGRNELPERTWETRSQVAAADRGREFAFVVGGSWVRWGYTFAPPQIRRRRRGPDRRPHRSSAPGHSGHAGRDQEGSRSG